MQSFNPLAAELFWEIMKFAFVFFIISFAQFVPTMDE